MNNLITAFKSSDIVPFYLGGCSAAISYDGQTLVTPLLEDIVISNPSTSEIPDKLEGDGEVITTLQITPDGKYAALVSQSQQLRIYDVIQKTIVKSFKLSSPVYMSAVDETSTLFAFGGSDGVITIWDIENGYVTHSLKGHGTTVSALSFYGELNSKSWFLVSGDIMGTLKIWDLVKRKNIQSFQDHNTTIRGCGFSRNGEILISGGRDQILNIYQLSNNNKRKLKNTILANQQIESCGFIEVKSKEYIYTAGSDSLLKIWDAESMKLVSSSESYLDTTEELMIINVLKSNGNVILVLSDQTLVEVDIEELSTPLPTIRRLAGNHGTIADLKLVGPNFDKIALATNSPSLRIIDSSNNMSFELYESHKDLLNGLDVTIDGKWIATCSKDNESTLWHYNDSDDIFEVYAKFIGHSASVTCCKLPNTPIDKQPNFLVTGSSDLTIKKWTIPKLSKFTGEPFIVKTSDYTRKAHEKDINALDMSPNDEFIATASFDKTGKIWDLESGEIIGILKGHKRGLWDIKFCSFDKLILTGSGDKTCKLWSLNDFTCLKTFEGHTNSVQNVSFLNRQKQVVTTGADGLIKIWDASNGESLETLDNHDNRIWSMYCDEINKFITGDADGKIAIWEDNTDELIAKREEEEKLKVENEQSLQNYIFNNDWPNAFLMALTLNHPMRLYNVIKSSIAANEDRDSLVGSFALENCISKLSADQLLVLLGRIKSWNVNSKTFEISQKLIKVILINYKIDDLIRIPGINNIIEVLAAYNERHMSRFNELIEQSFILDYTVDELNNSIIS